jgi:hypothetical protein
LVSIRGGIGSPLIVKDQPPGVGAPASGRYFVVSAVLITHVITTVKPFPAIFQSEIECEWQELNKPERTGPELVEIQIRTLPFIEMLPHCPATTHTVGFGTDHCGLRCLPKPGCCASYKRHFATWFNHDRSIWFT